MIRNVLIFLMLIAVTADGATPPVPLRTAANSMLRELQQRAAVKIFPEEYTSFRNTIAAAEAMQLSGDEQAAEKLFSFALVKGELLSRQLRARETAVTPAPPVSASPLPLPDGAGSPPPPAEPELPATDTVWRFEENIPEPDDSLAEIPRSRRIVGGEGIYVVRKKDSLRLVASRLGVSVRELARMNRLQSASVLRAGQKLKYNNRRIVPKIVSNGIIVNIPDRSLYLFKGGRLAARYPVAVGMAGKKDKTSWRTPTGKFRVIDKKENPRWNVPLSIQQEMAENGEEIIGTMPPGPKNPLGKHAIKTSLAGILIHGTTRPTSVNSFSSHGCIRVMPEHMESLFKSVKLFMPGEIIYQPVKVEIAGEGRVFLEVNHDMYEQVEDLSAEVRRLLKKHRVSDRVAWDKVMQVVSDRKGVAEEVTLQ